ncbi:hypothetical protein VCRA2122O340_70144 [Vibrio crassostreae]|nr:hypothetical protein VCRA2122O340_70144 [Vibrio crassostreae]CAK3987085.1 hypothetical protein VCRA2128O346_70144 [Vibrio crassostreae]
MVLITEGLILTITVIKNEVTKSNDYRSSRKTIMGLDKLVRIL